MFVAFADGWWQMHCDERVPRISYHNIHLPPHTWRPRVELISLVILVVMIGVCQGHFLWLNASVIWLDISLRLCLMNLIGFVYVNHVTSYRASFLRGRHGTFRDIFVVLLWSTVVLASALVAVQHSGNCCGVPWGHDEWSIYGWSFITGLHFSYAMLGSAIMRQWSGGKASKTVNGEPANQAIARHMPACWKRQRWLFWLLMAAACMQLLSRALLVRNSHLGHYILPSSVYSTHDHS